MNSTDLSVDEIMADVALALIAGTNTASKVMEYGFVLLSLNESVQDRICSELKELDGDGFIQQKVGKANVLNAFVQEALRLGAVQPIGLPHYAEKEVVLKEEGMVIPKGAIVHNNMHFMQRKGAKQDLVDIDQWLDGHGRFKNDPSSSSPFGFGRRSCPAAPLTKKLLLYTFSFLIPKYKFIAADSTRSGPIPKRFGTVHVIEPKIGIKLEKR